MPRKVLLVLLLLVGCGRYPIPTQPVVSSAPYKVILLQIGRNMNPSVTPDPMAYGVVDMNGSCATLDLIGVKWSYNYSTTPTLCTNIESVPMIQSGAQISNTLGGNSPWLLGFNEPEMSGFAHQTPDEGAQNWRLIEEKYPDKLLVSPSVISAGSYDALNWLHDFRTAYFNRYNEYPRLDALGVHIYFEYAVNAEPVITEAIELAREWGARGIFITEMGMAYGDPGGEEKLFLDWIQVQSAVLRYSWFGSDIDVQQGIEQGWYSPDWVDMSLAHNNILTPFGEVYTAVVP